MSLTLNDNVVVTDLAYEKANRLGMSLVSPKTVQPPAAPVRPYLSKELKNESIELNTAPAPAFNNLDNYVPFEKRDPVNTTVDFQNKTGLTSVAVTQNDIENPTSGYPRPTNKTRIDLSELQKRVQEEIQLRFGKLDSALLEKVIQRVFAGMGIE
ncbi:MAG: hypothetical protein C0410_00865 [Anaerolinea sp.]|nr:hypothetical protein [Anaerolinea sp.]